ncbi:MAG: HD domain-containing protein [Deltaproteobacteria bacterium]|jgi:tRNA nucleotidyltransferase (CCA-adding enzyme)|nr:HD domain-containing protein [Deltaproteobacteria bacterium]
MALELIEKLALSIKAMEGRLLLIGGRVRDGLARNDHFPNLSAGGDFDLVVFGLNWSRILSAAQKFGPARLVDHSHDDGSKKPALVRLSLDGLVLEISFPKNLTAWSNASDFKTWLEADALARDFTVNSIYWDPLEKITLDPLGGLADLRARRLDLCQPQALVRDPLRVLRAMVLIARRGYVSSQNLINETKKNWPGLRKVARDRLWPEWAKWSRSRWPHLGLRFLEESQALSFWPELAALVGSPQNAQYHPEGDVWNHTVLVTQAMAELDVSEAERKSHWLLAALLHDVGKPLATRLDENGRPLTKGHPEAGVPVAKAFLRSQRAPEKVVDVVAKLTRWHMELAFKHLSAEGLRRVARLLKPQADLVDYWALSAADWNGRRPRVNFFAYSLEEYLDFVGGERTVPKPLLTGNDLIRVFNLRPGPRVGFLLNKVELARDQGEIETPEEAIEWIKRHLTGDV